MSVPGFETHVDKENTTSASSIINKGGAKTNYGLNGDGWKLQKNSPRKLLLNVSNEPVNRAAFRDQRGKHLILTKDGVYSSTRTPLRTFSGTEHFVANINNRKLESRSPLMHEGLKILPDCELHLSKTQPMGRQDKSQPPQTEPGASVEDCESASIFPASERLSSYVGKLLAWRPPCLFGIRPDSESDKSDVESLPLGDIMLDMPLFMATAPECSDKGLAHRLSDFPPEKDEDEEPNVCQNKDAEMSFDLTNDVSFSFGSLHFKHGSLNNSQVSEANLSSNFDQSQL